MKALVYTQPFKSLLQLFIHSISIQYLVCAIHANNTDSWKLKIASLNITLISALNITPHPPLKPVPDISPPQQIQTLFLFENTHGDKKHVSCIQLERMYQRASELFFPWKGRALHRKGLQGTRA